LTNGEHYNCLKGKNQKTNITFPKRVMRTANLYRRIFIFVEDNSLQSNIAYSLMYIDLIKWLLMRFDFYATIKEMIIKEGITIIGNIIESLIYYVYHKIEPQHKSGFDASQFKKCMKKCSMDKDIKKRIIDLVISRMGKSGFCHNTKYLLKKHIIDKSLYNDINNVYNKRCNSHLYMLKSKEYEKYKIEDYNFAINALNRLRKSLSLWFSEQGNQGNNQDDEN